MTQDDIQSAQIAFTGEASWTIIAQGRRYTGLHSHFPMPTVYCPIVDTTSIASDALLRKALADHINPYGVREMEQFVDQLEKLGANIAYPVPLTECTCSPNQNREVDLCPACLSHTRYLHSEELPY